MWQWKTYRVNTRVESKAEVWRVWLCVRGVGVVKGLEEGVV